MSSSTGRRLFHTDPVDDKTVADLLASSWPGAVLGHRIKSSQNVTYKATLSDGKDCIVRATATPGAFDRILAEVQFVAAMEAAGVAACGPIAPWLAKNGDTVIVVSRFARGVPVVFTDWVWANDERFVRAQGRWLAQFHNASRAYAAKHPAITSAIQPWDRVHEGILAGAAPLTGPMGITHGDINPSNFHAVIDAATGSVDIDVFDWDQAQYAWFSYDLAQPLWAVTMIASAGMPVSGDRVDGLDPAQFSSWLLEEYNAVIDGAEHRISTEALAAALALRRCMYERFCRRASAEGDIPADMMAFIDWVVAAFDAKRL